MRSIFWNYALKWGIGCLWWDNFEIFQKLGSGRKSLLARGVSGYSRNWFLRRNVIYIYIFFYILYSLAYFRKFRIIIQNIFKSNISFYFKLNMNEIIHFLKFWEVINELGKTCFPFGKMKFWTHWKF